MHNKKLKGSVAMLALSAVLVGGTFAWLGATDSVKNIFTTTGSQGAESKVEIYEKFDNAIVTTESRGNKQVQVQNNSNYNSLIRVKFTKEFENTNLTKSDYIQLRFVTDEDGNELVKNVLDLNGSETLESLRQQEIHWIQDGEYYYYLGNVRAKDGFTTQLLDSVYLSNDAIVDPDPAYRNAKFNVTVHADSIQSTIDAITSKEHGTNQGTEVKGFGLTNENLVSLLTEVITKGEVGSAEQIEGATATTEDVRQ